MRLKTKMKLMLKLIQEVLGTGSPPPSPSLPAHWMLRYPTGHDDNHWLCGKHPDGQSRMEYINKAYHPNIIHPGYQSPGTKWKGVGEEGEGLPEHHLIYLQGSSNSAYPAYPAYPACP
jgi:hypothetical protein